MESREVEREREGGGRRTVGCFSLLNKRFGVHISRLLVSEFNGFCSKQ